jgi:hypothetical protein
MEGEKIMRRRNWRVVSAGVLLIVMALAFYFVMVANAGSSTNPLELMQLTGALSGGAIGLSVAMIIIGLIGKKA